MISCNRRDVQEAIFTLSRRLMQPFNDLLMLVAVQVDKPLGAEAYVCPHVGGYKLQEGQLEPFPQALAGPIMLVSTSPLAASCCALCIQT